MCRPVDVGIRAGGRQEKFRAVDKADVGGAVRAATSSIRRA
jgi:hypothetical protein